MDERGRGMKYYFIKYRCYTSSGSWIHENNVINEHPIDWQLNANSEYPNETYLVEYWQEINQGEYYSFNGRLG